MDEKSKAEQDRILALEAAALTEPDKAFLRARASYVPEDQLKQYAEILAPVSNEVQDEEPKPKKGKV